MEIGDKVRVKSLDEVLKIEGLKDYRQAVNPGIAYEMLDCFGNEGWIRTDYGNGEYELLINNDTWYFRKEWLELVSTVKVEEIKNPTHDDLLPLFSGTEPVKGNIATPWTTTPEDFGGIGMKTSEFIKRVEELEYEAVDDFDGIGVYRDDSMVAIVCKNKVNKLDTYWEEDIPSELFDMLVEYAKTPIEERKDVKKYYLYNPVKKSYFNYYYTSETYNWFTSKPFIGYQNQFTEEEIKNNPYRDIMELLEKVEVE